MGHVLVTRPCDGGSLFAALLRFIDLARFSDTQDEMDQEVDTSDRGEGDVD